MPAPRTSFFEEQARRRRQTWRGSLLCGLAACVMGAPLAVLATPIVFLAAGGALHLLPGGRALLPELVASGRAIPRAVGAAFESGTLEGFLRARVLASLFQLLAPGMILLVAVWALLRARFTSAGVGELLMTLSAREPRTGDLEENQLVNVVAEMAIAAGIPPPAVRLLDNEAPNAAALGSDHEHATVVVSRAVLDRLDRDETQSLVGHLVASIGNGDLDVLASVNAVFQSVGLVLLVLDAFFGTSPSAFRDLWRVFRFLVGGSADPALVAEMEQLLVTSPDQVREDGIYRFSESRWVKRFPPLYVLLLPFLLLYVVSLLLGWQVWILRMLIVGPLSTLVIRARRYLADASAVQLTRNPDALARALDKLSIDEALVARAQWCEPLFVVGAGKGAWSEEMGGLVRAHPPIQKRLARITAMGGVDRSETKPRVRWTPIQTALVALFAVPLVAVVVSLLFFVLWMSFALAALPSLFLTLLALSAVLALVA